MTLVESRASIINGPTNSQRFLPHRSGAKLPLDLCFRRSLSGASGERAGIPKQPEVHESLYYGCLKTWGV